MKYPNFELFSKRLPEIALLICSVSGAALLAIKLWALISFHPDISGSETSTIFPIQLLVDGRQLYTNPEEPPFLLSQYTPIYFSIVAGFFELTSWTADDLRKVYVMSRIVSLFFLVTTVLAFSLMVFFYTKQTVSSILAGLLVFHILSFWFLTNSRPDSLLALSTILFLGATFKAIATSDEDNVWWYVAIVIAIVSFFVKQSGMIQSIIVGSYCILQGRFKLLGKLILAGILSVVVMLALLPINTLTLFLTNIVGGVANSVSWDWFYSWTLDRLLLPFGAFLAIGFMLSIYWLTKSSSPLYRFISLALLIFFVFDIAISFKIGAGVGYFQDFIIVCIFAIVLFFSDRKEMQGVKSDVLKGSLFLFVILVCIHCSLHVIGQFRGQPMDLYTAQYLEERELSEYLYNEKKLLEDEWVYVERGGKEFSGYLLSHFLFRNAIMPFLDIVEYGQANGTFNYAGFEKMVKDKKIRFVISGKGNPPENVLNYEWGNSLIFCCSHGKFDIYEAN